MERAQGGPFRLRCHFSVKRAGGASARRATTKCVAAGEGDQGDPMGPMGEKLCCI